MVSDVTDINCVMSFYEIFYDIRLKTITNWWSHLSDMTKIESGEILSLIEP